MSNLFEISGTVHRVFETQTFSSGFTKREFVLEVEDGNYPQMVKFECIKDKTSMLDDVSESDKVQVTFNIRGNEHKERFYVSLVAWKLKSLSGLNTRKSEQENGSNKLRETQKILDEADETDDIPF